MPFGLCNATSTMSRLKDKVVPPHYRNEVFVYLDDLLVVSSSFETHLVVLRELAVHIKRAVLTINVSKSIFACDVYGIWDTSLVMAEYAQIRRKWRLSQIF